jgi:Domain of unknown function (DUF4440)
MGRTMTGDQSLEKDLHSFEEHLLQPSVQNSPEALAALLADDFLEFGSSGRICDQLQVITDLHADPPTRRSVFVSPRLPARLRPFFVPGAP